VGVGLALAYWAYALFRPDSREENNYLWRWLIGTIVVALLIIVPLYNISPTFKANTRFAFEGFFSLVEKGRWEVHSNNILMDMYIFQFEGLSYDNSISDEILANTINEVFKDDYLFKYTSDFINAGKESKVSPVYLASLSKQEVGGSLDPNSAISGTVPGYENYYNFYNIGAYSGDNPVLNGLSFAKGTDELVQRPWNTEYKAIVGGALWIANNYIGFGQNNIFICRRNKSC
jgi:beta-N-acetylglucosaminidase